MHIGYDDLEPGDFAKTTFDGGLPKLVRAWEALRDINSGGYGSGILVNIKDWHPAYGGGKTDCSPFTATAIALALDPSFDGSTPAPTKTYQPVFSGGEPLGRRFYHLHNGFSLGEYQYVDKKGKTSWKSDFETYRKRLPQIESMSGFVAINDSAGSVVAFNMGERKKWTEMRRGDLLGMDWNNPKRTGHAAFCWNVHLNGAGDVDAFQIIGANSAGETGAGITVYTYADQVMDRAFLENKSGKYQKLKPMFTPVLDDPQALQQYTPSPNVWFGIPGVKKKNVDLDSFGVKTVMFVEAGSIAYSVGALRVARLFGVTPPEPYLISGKTTKQSAPPPPVAQVKSKKAEAPAAEPAKSTPSAPAKETPPPEKAAPGDPQPFQADVEANLQILWIARWIEKDPGDPKQINDAQSQEALKDYQQKFMSSVKVPHPGHPDPETRKRLARSAGSAVAMPLVYAALQMLFKRGILSTAPGDALGRLDDKTRAAVKEFQEKNGLEADGIPGPATQTKLGKAMSEASRQQESPAKDDAPAKQEAAPAKASSTEPAITLMYWVPAYGAPGQEAAVKVTATDACNGKSYKIGLYSDGKALVEDSGAIAIAAGKGSLEVNIPAGVAPGAEIEARLSGDGLNAATKSRFRVEKPGGPIAIVDGENIVVDPPVRLLPQWDDRWGGRNVAGPDQVHGAATWQNSGCCPSCAATILRWFAEDCRAGRVPFPAAEGTKIAAGFYGPRMGQAFWPEGFAYYRKGKFAAEPDRPGNPDGKVELNDSGVDFKQLFDKAAKWLGKEKAHFVSSSGGDWMAVIRQLLRDGPCILGIGPPAKPGHFVVAQGIKDGALLIVDPGNVLYQAVKQSGNPLIDNWNGMKSLETGVGKPPASQWPGGKLPKPGSEDSNGGYVAISGTVLKNVLAGLKWIHSLSHPGGPVFSGQASSAQGSDAGAADEKPQTKDEQKPQPEEKKKDEQPAQDKLEVFFKYRGWIGPAFGKSEGYENNKAYTYVGYRVPGKTTWFLRGRGNVDVDGAPNAYHPDPKMDRNFVHAGELATWDVMRLDRPLENLANGPVGLQKKDGKLYVQTASDPCPGFYVMHTPLRRNQFDAWDPREYADARKIPYFAIPTQILGQANTPSKLDNFGGWEAVGKGHTGNYGDYVTAINLNPRAYKTEKNYPPDYLKLIEINGKKYPIAHGIIGDAGNQPHIGECSYALGKMLHTLNGPEYADVLWMIHPGTGKGQYFIPEPNDIQANGEKLFNEWGGQKQLAAILKLPELSSNGS